MPPLNNGKKKELMEHILSPLVPFNLFARFANATVPHQLLYSDTTHTAHASQEPNQTKQARKSSEDAQAAGFAQFEKVWAG